MFECLSRWTLKKSNPIKINNVVLIVGHDQKRQGAYSYNGVSEYQFNKEFAHTIQHYTETLNINCHIILRDGIGIKGSYSKALKKTPFLIVELHLNAFNGEASGCEILISDSYDKKTNEDERFIATKVLDVIHNTLNNRKRGIKHRASKGERGFYNLSQVTSVPSILIEPAFCDNKQDFDNLVEKKDKLAKNLALCFESVFRSL